MKGPTAAPRLTNDEIHEACSGVMGVSNGLSDKSVPASFGIIGEDHIIAVPEISISMFAEKEKNARNYKFMLAIFIYVIKISILGINTIIINYKLHYDKIY